MTKYDKSLESPQAFADLLVGASRLNQYKDDVAQIGDSQDEESLKLLSKLAESSSDLIEFQKGQIKNIIEHLTAIINERCSQDLSENLCIPTKSELQQKFADFITSEIPLASTPYPNLCGALAWPADKIVPNNYYVCAPFNEDYILAIVLCFDPETFTYKVTDVDPQEEEIQIFEVPADKVIPLPTSLPARRNKLVTFSTKERVLALWKDFDGWTSVFYPAIVVGQPNSTNGSNYLLRYDGDESNVYPIPERFVIKAPSQFKNAY